MLLYRVFAQNSKHRGMVTSDGKAETPSTAATDSPPESKERRKTMSWAMRLKRVFNIDITVCRYCQGNVRIIACIEDAQTINQILSPINQQQKRLTHVNIGLGIRAPPANATSVMNP